MNSPTTFINERFVEFEKEIKKINKEIRSFRKESRYLTKRIEEIDAVLDRQEQYSRRNCILIHGIDEIEREDTNELSIKVIEKHMNQETKAENIDRSHRLGNPKNLKILKLNPL